MNLRQRLELLVIVALTFLAFANYHEVSGSVAWIQWLAVLSIMAFVYIFDVAFTNESMFIFDPDADNWRRKVVSTSQANTHARTNANACPCWSLLIIHAIFLMCSIALFQYSRNLFKVRSDPLLSFALFWEEQGQFYASH